MALSLGPRCIYATAGEIVTQCARLFKTADAEMAESKRNVLRLGTRGSLLATRQSSLVADELRRRHSGLTIEMITIRTSGDRITDRPLHEFGGKGLFTRELEVALLAGKIDFAVHSFKDVPVTMPLVESAELVFTAVPVREDPRDVLVASRAMDVSELERGARIGTGSPRRAAQMLAIRPDLIIEPIRGNIDTRIRKQRAGEVDATLLAMAGLNRSGLFDGKTMKPLGVEEFIPAAGQGALALQCRAKDEATRELLAVVDDATTRACVAAERAVVQGLRGDCHSPIAAYARMAGNRYEVTAAVGRRDGAPPVIRASASGTNVNAAAEEALRALLDGGAERLLRE